MQALEKRRKAKGGYREVLVIATPLILSTGAWSVQHFVERCTRAISQYRL